MNFIKSIFLAAAAYGTGNGAAASNTGSGAASNVTPRTLLRKTNSEDEVCIILAIGAQILIPAPYNSTAASCVINKYDGSTEPIDSNACKAATNLVHDSCVANAIYANDLGKEIIEKGKTPAPTPSPTLSPTKAPTPPNFTYAPTPGPTPYPDELKDRWAIGRIAIGFGTASATALTGGFIMREIDYQADLGTTATSLLAASLQFSNLASLQNQAAATKQNPTQEEIKLSNAANFQLQAEAIHSSALAATIAVSVATKMAPAQIRIFQTLLLELSLANLAVGIVRATEDPSRTDAVPLGALGIAGFPFTFMLNVYQGCTSTQKYTQAASAALAIPSAAAIALQSYATNIVSEVECDRPLYPTDRFPILCNPLGAGGKDVRTKFNISLPIWSLTGGFAVAMATIPILRACASRTDKAKAKNIGLIEEIQSNINKASEIITGLIEKQVDGFKELNAKLNKVTKEFEDINNKDISELPEEDKSKLSKIKHEVNEVITAATKANRQYAINTNDSGAGAGSDSGSDSSSRSSWQSSSNNLSDGLLGSGGSLN